ncbi:hypothetical protein B0T17DRAFT_257857 [Bombardia bombarda]|uniref:Uncharacterized protein n=1 Tax=Bombardia bombarda TaxID=252184 RepID=A0AA39X0L6_9PEZI|nr:hypothetical protein B0T17DRAFT_257857 [Bombardia bombarda]
MIKVLNYGTLMRRLAVKRFFPLSHGIRQNNSWDLAGNNMCFPVRFWSLTSNPQASWPTFQKDTSGYWGIGPKKKVPIFLPTCPIKFSTSSCRLHSAFCPQKRFRHFVDQHLQCLPSVPSTGFEQWFTAPTAVLRRRGRPFCVSSSDLAPLVSCLRLARYRRLQQRSLVIFLRCSPLSCEEKFSYLSSAAVSSTWSSASAGHYKLFQEGLGSSWRCIHRDKRPFQKGAYKVARKLQTAILALEGIRLPSRRSQL